ncbi:hypothetical protein B0A52_09593 [Exophiala mesophila]|uniref:Small ribosomal subunit protein uS5m n=1 Tax=Exophiala mesophila TaxID=212818 RepID=A0A438MUR6_EXOME|nr:hypothetical protein B0A52_09593 [Exophiala mesophila]
MSVTRTAECLLCSFTRSSRTARPSQSTRRPFSSTTLRQNRKPRFPSVKAPVPERPKHPLSYLNHRADQFFSGDGTLPGNYTREQRAAIEAAKKFDTMKHLKEYRGGMRTGPYKLEYFDDLTQIDPVIDKPVRNPMTNIDDNQRMKDDEDFADDFLEQAMQSHQMINVRDESGTEYLDDEVADDAWNKFDQGMRMTTGRPEAELAPPSALAPDLPLLSPSNLKQKSSSKNSDSAGQDKQAVSPELITLLQMTGLTPKQFAGIRVRSLIQHRVVNQTRLGKIQRIYTLAVAGNGNGLIGIGEAKSAEASDARIQSQYRAIRNMQPILRYENRTIFGQVKAKVSATELELSPRPPGFGLRCQQYIWEICKCAGIADISAKVRRARNPMNMVKAAVQALASQKDPEDIARGRGKKLVDVRKVYYAGRT